MKQTKAFYLIDSFVFYFLETITPKINQIYILYEVPGTPNYKMFIHWHFLDTFQTRGDELNGLGPRPIFILDGNFSKLFHDTVM